MYSDDFIGTKFWFSIYLKEKRSSKFQSCWQYMQAQGEARYCLKVTTDMLEKYAYVKNGERGIGKEGDGG